VNRGIADLEDSRLPISDRRSQSRVTHHVSRLARCLSALLFLAGGCGTDRPPPPAAAPPGTTDLVARLDASLAKAAQYLVSKQSDDGAWRSETYGCFRDGPELSPHILSGLFFLPQVGEGVRPAFDKGASFMMKLVTKDGQVDPGPHGLNFPVLTAGSASRVVVLEKKDEPHLRARSAWLAYLRERQLAEANGWPPDDPAYGGWGFSIEIPRKPKEGQPRERFFESNMVATIFGIAALRSLKVPLDDPIYPKVLAFVKRCQNFSDDPEKADPAFDDGGFFFIPDDPLQNKAGAAGKDRLGRTRFRSYGSMTADGLRALLRCGLPPDHPRVAAARKWLETHFTAQTNPGRFAPDRELLRDATYYYYCWAVAHALLAVGGQEVQTQDGKVRWAEALAEELVRRQRPDGSWTNRFTDAKEDDPLVSTPWASAALAICRGVITGQHKAIGRPCLMGIPNATSQIPD